MKQKQNVIMPTVGRIVWYWPDGKPKKDDQQPYAAQVCYVWDAHKINIAYLNHGGTHGAAVNVPLLQPGSDLPEGSGFCMWMPYQVVSRGD